MTREPFYEAHWYDPETCMRGEDFDPYKTTVASFDHLQEAQSYAVRMCAKTGFFSGWCAVYEITPDNHGSCEVTSFMTNEIYKNKWSGWEQKEWPS